MDFREYLNENKKVEKLFKELIKKLPNDLEWKTNSEVLSVFKNGKEIAIINKVYADDVEKNLKFIKDRAAGKERKVNPKDVMDLGNLDWEKHGDGF